MGDELLEFKERYARETGVLAEVHPDDYMFRFLISNPAFRSVERAVRYYFYDGQSSARRIEEILFRHSNLPRDASILEFACGYGCVTRHLVKLLPREILTGSDIHPEANQFLSQKLGVRTIQSSSAPRDFPPHETFDAVVALSFFSHVPLAAWGNWLEKLFSLVKMEGVLVFTTHGVESLKHFGNPPLSQDGTWFAARSEQKDLDVQQYGQTITTIDYVANQVFTRVRDEGIFTMIRQAFWWDHQDLYVLRRSGR